MKRNSKSGKHAKEKNATATGPPAQPEPIEGARSPTRKELFDRAKKRRKSGDRLDYPSKIAKLLTKARDEEKDLREARVSQPTADFESGEDVAAAITEKCDLVELGAELLTGTGDTKNASTKLRMWEAIMERMFGKAAPAAREEDRAPQVVLDGLPRPERNPTEGEKS
jgi:hypothetical protein